MQAYHPTINTPSYSPSNDLLSNKKGKRKELEEETVDSQQTKMEVPSNAPPVKRLKVSQEDFPSGSSTVSSVFQEKVKTQIPIKDEIIEIQIPIPEEKEPKVYSIPREWLINLSTVYKEIILSKSGWNDSKIKQNMEWKRRNNECLHPKAGEIIIQFIYQYCEKDDLSLPKDLLDEANWPILLDIFDIADSLGMIPLQEACKQLIDQAIKEDLENANHLFPFILSLPEAEENSLWVGAVDAWIKSVAASVYKGAKPLDLIYSLSEADLSSLDENQQRKAFIILNDAFGEVILIRHREIGWQDSMEEFYVACKLFFSFASLSYLPLFYRIVEKADPSFLPLAAHALKICQELKDKSNVIIMPTTEIEEEKVLLKLIEALIKIEKRDFQEALKGIEEGLKTKYHLFALYLKGRVLVYNSEFNEALSIYNQILEIYPRHSAALANRGGYYFKLTNVNLAMRDLDRALEINPYNCIALAARALCFKKQGQQDAAIQDCNRELTIHPSSTALILKGKCHKKKGEYDKAINHFSSALEMDKNNIFALIQRSRCYRKINQKQLADIDIRLALQINSHHIIVLHESIKSRLSIDWNPEGALKTCNSILKRVPDYPSTLALRGNYYLKTGSLHLAIKDFDQALKVKKTTSTLNRRGSCHIQLGNPHLALQDFEESLKIKPNNNSFALAGIGICYTQLNRLDLALQYLANDTDISLALIYRAYCFKLMGDEASKKKCLGVLSNKIKKAFSRAKTGNKSPFKPLLLRGIVLRLSFNNFQDAIKNFNRVLTQNPNHILALSERGQCYLDMGNLQLALQDFNKILELDPNNVSALVYRRTCYKRMDKPELAEQDFEMAKTIDPQHPFLKATTSAAESYGRA